MPKSMTGFARTEDQYEWGTLACEIRSVNHRYLEPTLRLPEGLRAIESDFRGALKKYLSRGKIEVSLHLKLESKTGADLALNETLANQIQMLAQQIADQLPNSASLSPIEILKWPGVLQSAEIDKDELETASLKTLDTTLKALVQNRTREGRELGIFIEQRLDSINEHVANLRKRLPEILETNHNKLRERLKALEVDIDEDRLAQEQVYIAQKADVAEELDRLEAHVSEVLRTLKQNEPIGRRLDFLMQELNREANTLASKSIANDITQNSVDLKVLIEQMREQVQNLE